MQPGESPYGVLRFCTNPLNKRPYRLLLTSSPQIDHLPQMKPSEDEPFETSALVKLSAKAAIVGFTNSAWTGRSMPSASRIRDMTLIANKECPPRSKKSS